MFDRTAWRTALKHNLAVFAPLTKQRPHIDKIHTLIGAALLWAIRERQPDHLTALNAACADSVQAALLIDAMDGWKKREPLEALEELERERRKDPALHNALATLLGIFIVGLLDDHILQTRIDINAPISGGNIIIGGKQVVLGDFIIQYIKPKTDRFCPQPPQRPAFGGRESELTRLAAKLQNGESAPITIPTALQGTGGIGKTTLARMLANLLFEQKQVRAVLWATVTRTPNPAAILNDWVVSYADSSFDVSAFQGDLSQIAAAAKNQLEGVISEKCETCESPRVLVVLDDVWENGIGAAQALRDACPSSTTLLITTRSIKVASAFHVQADTISYLDADGAAELLIVYLPQTDETKRKRLGKALGGYPLALELAARRVLNEAGRYPSLAAALDACTADYETGIPAGKAFRELELEEGETKENNVTISLSYSYETLSSEAQARFRMLGILAVDAPVERALLAALWAIPLEQVDKAADLLRHLGLIEFAEGVYTQHAVLRAYASALLAQTDETEATFEKYADHIIEVGELFHTLPREDWNATLEASYPHILHMGDELEMRYQTQPQYIERAQAFAYKVKNYLIHHQVVRPSWLMMGLNSARALSTLKEEAEQRLYKHRESTFLHQIGLNYVYLGQPSKALQYYEQAATLDQEIQDWKSFAITLHEMAAACRDMGEASDALRLWEEARRIFEKQEDKLYLATVLQGIGTLYIRLKQPHTALEYFQEAKSILEESDDSAGLGATLYTIGLALNDADKSKEALEQFKEAQTIFEKLYDRKGLAAVINGIGAAYLNLNRLSEAIPYFQKSLGINKEISDYPGIAANHYFIALTWGGLRNIEAALISAQEGKRIMAEFSLQRDLSGHLLLDYEDLISRLKSLNQSHFHENATSISKGMQRLATTTQSVMTDRPLKLKSHSADVIRAHKDAIQKADWSRVQFLDALLAILNGQPVTIPPDKAYADVVQQVTAAIAAYRSSTSEN